MNVSRVARNVAAGVVAAIAAWSSYSHMVSVALRYGEHPSVAYVLPFSADGLLVVASVAMVDDKIRGTSRLVTRIAFTAGVLASIGANIAAASPSIGARIVAGWPAVALLLVVEILASGGGRKPASDPPAAAPAVEPLREPRAEPATPRRPVQRPSRVSLTACRRLRRPVRVPRATRQRALRPAIESQPAPAQPAREPRAEVPRRTRRPLAETLALVEAIRAKNPDATRDDLADELGLSRRRVDEILATSDA